MFITSERVIGKKKICYEYIEIVQLFYLNFIIDRITYSDVGTVFIKF